MKLKDALEQLNDSDPYETRYTWLYLPTSYAPSVAALYIVRPEDMHEAGISIYDDSYDALAHTVGWMLTDSGCSWYDLNSLPPSVTNSPFWQVSTGNRIASLIKGDKQ